MVVSQSSSNLRSLKSASVDADYFANARPQIIVQDPRAGGGKHATLMEAITNGKPVYFYEESPEKQQLRPSHAQVHNDRVRFIHLV